MTLERREIDCVAFAGSRYVGVHVRSTTSIMRALQIWFPRPSPHIGASIYVGHTSVDESDVNRPYRTLSPNGKRCLDEKMDEYPIIFRRRTPACLTDLVTWSFSRIPRTGEDYVLMWRAVVAHILAGGDSHTLIIRQSGTCRSCTSVDSMAKPVPKIA